MNGRRAANAVSDLKISALEIRRVFRPHGAYQLNGFFKLPHPHRSVWVWIPIRMIFALNPPRPDSEIHPPFADHVNRSRHLRQHGRRAIPHARHQRPQAQGSRIAREGSEGRPGFENRGIYCLIFVVLAAEPRPAAVGGRIERHEMITMPERMDTDSLRFLGDFLQLPVIADIKALERQGRDESDFHHDARLQRRRQNAANPSMRLTLPAMRARNDRKRPPLPPVFSRRYLPNTTPKAPRTERNPPATTRQPTASCFLKNSQDRKMISSTERRFRGMS